MLGRFTFELVLGVRKMDDIHAVLLQQLIFLAERGRVKVLLRVDDGSRSREGMESITFST